MAIHAFSTLFGWTNPTGYLECNPKDSCNSMQSYFWHVVSNDHNHEHDKLLLDHIFSWEEYNYILQSAPQSSETKVTDWQIANKTRCECDLQKATIHQLVNMLVFITVFSYITISWHNTLSSRNQKLQYLTVALKIGCFLHHCQFSWWNPTPCTNFFWALAKVCWSLLRWVTPK